MDKVLAFSKKILKEVIDKYSTTSDWFYVKATTNKQLPWKMWSHFRFT